MTTLIEEIRQKIANNEFELSKHALDKSTKRRISINEIRETVASGLVIEDYPDDKYSPSCLISGFTLANRAVHVQCSYPGQPLIKIITVYEPNPQLWEENFKRRRSRNDE
jgi:Domain of unknown function (DUF4258)